MDFVRSHFGKMKLWPVEHFWLTFFPDQHRFSADLEKKWAKSVQLVRVSFFLSDFLQNPYFSGNDHLAKEPLFLVLIKPSPKKWTDFRSNCKIIFKRRCREGDAIFAAILHHTSSCYNLKRRKTLLKEYHFEVRRLNAWLNSF